MNKKIDISDGFLASFQPLKKEPEKRTIHLRILIVCEGKKTEPNYFRALINHVNKNGVYVVDTDENSITVTIDGTYEGDGENTKSVIKTALKLKDKEEMAGNSYDCVWVVFDRDSFPKEKFNTAIAMASQHNLRCAYSNEAFELWYLFHFVNRVTAMSRKEYEKAIENQINAFADVKKKKDVDLCKQYKKDFPSGYHYKKNDPKTFEYVTKYGSMEQAIKWTKQQQSVWTDKRYSEHNPTTLVYELVEMLLGRDKEFNEQLADKL